MAGAAEPPLDDLMWTAAVARLIFGPAMNIQAPPNLMPDALEAMVAAGINDWGGVSPVTPDHVKIGPQAAALFEPPEGYSKLPPEAIAPLLGLRLKPVSNR